VPVIVQFRVLERCALALLAGISASSSQPIAADSPFGCPVSVNGNEYLTIVGLGGNGIIVAPPTGANLEPDGALRWKIGWVRHVRGKLTINGRRIDSPAPPLRSEFSDYGESGFQATHVIFPTPGCWRVTGHVAGHGLTAVILALQREGLRPTPDQRWL